MSKSKFATFSFIQRLIGYSYILSITIFQTLLYLFSEDNSILDVEKCSEIPEGELDHPLSHYWINSSHNTLVCFFLC